MMGDFCRRDKGSFLVDFLLSDGEEHKPQELLVGVSFQMIARERCCVFGVEKGEEERHGVLGDIYRQMGKALGSSKLD